MSTNVVVGVSVNPEITVRYERGGGSKHKVLDRREGVSGTSLDVTLWLREFGLPTHLIGAVGDGSIFTDAVDGFLRRRGIPSLLMPVRERTSLAIVAIDGDGTHPFHLSDRAAYLPGVEVGAVARVEDYIAPLAPMFRIATGVVPDDVFLVRALLGRCAGGVTRILNPRASLLEERQRTLLMEVLAHTDVMILNHQELAAFSAKARVEDPSSLAAAVESLQDLGPSVVIVTCAEQGSYLFERGETPHHERAISVGPLVDETGAGDAFLAGMVIARTCGWTYHQAMPFAALLSAFALTEMGGAAVKPRSEVIAKWRNLYPTASEICRG